MLKNLSQLEHVIENKVCRFVCEFDTPIHFIKEALFQFQKYIGTIEDAAIARQKIVEEVTKPTQNLIQEPIQDPQPVAIEGNEHA